MRTGFVVILAMMLGVVVDAPLPALSAGVCDQSNRKLLRACRASLLPPAYSAGDMGYPDMGGAPMAHPAHRRSVTSLKTSGRPDRSFRLTASVRQIRVAGHLRRVYAINGRTPGPTLRVIQGDVVKVVLRNRNIRQGTSLHWHGVDLTARNDGVSGLTQNAVLPGRRYVYRFVVPDAGTYWYHSHQHGREQTAGGLFGAIVVAPSTDPPAGPDMVAALHSYGDAVTLNGRRGEQHVTVTAGMTARIRFINTDNGPLRVGASVPYRLLAVDGFEVASPSMVSEQYVEVPAGGRVDLGVEVGAQPARVGMVGGPSLVVGPAANSPPGRILGRTKLDLLTYGGGGGPPALGPVDRSFRYVIAQRFGFLDGRRGNWYTINGRSLPDVPMYMVATGDVVRLHFENRTGVPHPMHLHGHHFVVVARNGVPSTGSPWWADSLEVDPGETYTVEFVADNPGIWMFHCHNLPHVRQGLMSHLMYADVRTPFLFGRVRPGLVNVPE